MAEIRLALSRAGAVVWRNNVGLAWYGKNREIPVKYGLCNGSSDLIGFIPVLITPEMVGRTIAAFVAIECKKPAGSRRTDEQKNFVRVVHGAGGMAGFARTAEEALAIVSP